MACEQQACAKPKFPGRGKAPLEMVSRRVTLREPFPTASVALLVLGALLQPGDHVDHRRSGCTSHWPGQVEMLSDQLHALGIHEFKCRQDLT